MKPNKLSKKQLWSWKTNTVAEAQYLTNLMYSGLSPRRKIMADKVLALKPQRAKMIRGGKCLNGHDLTPENIEEHPRNNSFACKICVNAKRRDRYALKKAQRDAILAP